MSNDLYGKDSFLREYTRGEASYYNCVCIVTNWDLEARKCDFLPVGETAAARTQPLQTQAAYRTSIRDLQTDVRNININAYNRAMAVLNAPKKTAGKLFMAEIERDFYHGRQYEDV
jgi:hypothetical protein